MFTKQNLKLRSENISTLQVIFVRECPGDSTCLRPLGVFLGTDQ